MVVALGVVRTSIDARNEASVQDQQLLQRLTDENWYAHAADSSSDHAIR